MHHTPLEILFEDPYICIINKPSEIHSVESVESDDNDSKADSIAAQLIQLNPAFAEASPKKGDGGLLNRLDFETSGIMLAAKNRYIWEFMFQEQRAGKIEKSYLSLVERHLPERQYVKTWIYSRYRSSKKVSIKPLTDKQPERAQAAESVFEKIIYLSKEDLTLVKVTAHSARRHQIRAHASYIGHPLCGDTLYDSKRLLREALIKTNAEKTQTPAFALHAYSLKFRHPEYSEFMKFEAPYNSQIYGNVA